MNLTEIVGTAVDKKNFLSVADYLKFSRVFLTFLTKGLQATIVSQNENHYCFYQYKDDGNFNISRPINSKLMYGLDDIDKVEKTFPKLLANIRDIAQDDAENREILTRSIYTIQQCVGAALDALPAGRSNQARKINGDLFERLIQELLKLIGVSCNTGTVQVPVYLGAKFSSR